MIYPSATRATVTHALMPPLVTHYLKVGGGPVVPPLDEHKKDNMKKAFRLFMTTTMPEGPAVQPRGTI